MSATHPCPSCGWTLRWVPEQSVWGCDRCGNRIAPQAQPQAQPQANAGWQQAVATNPGVAPAGGSFGGSAAGSSPMARSPSQPPGVYTAPAAPRPPSSASQPNYAYGEAPPGQAQPPNPYAGAGQSQFGAPAFVPPQAAGFGGSATGATPQRPRAPSSAPPASPGYPAPQPAPVVEVPQPGYGPGGYPSYVPPPAEAVEAPVAPRSKRSLMIGIGACVVIGIGIVIALAVGRGGGSKPGLASADDVVSQTLTALAGGDVDKLIALTGLEDNQKSLDCEEGAAPDPAKAIAASREQLGKVAGKAKGLTIDLVKLGPAKTSTVAAGTEVTKGCKLADELAMHDHEITVKIKHADKAAKERTYKLMLTESGGRWFLAAPPQVERPGDCTAGMRAMLAARRAEFDQAKVGDAARARLEKVAIQRCTEDSWPDAVVTCFEEAGKSCAKQLTVEQAERLDNKLGTILAEDAKSREDPTATNPENPTTPAIDPTVDPTKTAAGSGSGSGSGSVATVDEDASDELPSSCADYKAEIDKLAACRRVKASIKKGQQDSYAAIVDGWNRVRKKTPEMHASTGEICKKAVVLLVDLRKTACR